MRYSVSVLFFSICFQSFSQAPDTLWTRCYGGASYENAKSVRPTVDGGLIVIGSTTSYDGEVEGNHGSSDIWVVKLDESGEPEWTKTLGGTYQDEGFDIVQLPDESYVLAGHTISQDGDVSMNHGQTYDAWIVKLSVDGELVWDLSIGGSDNEELYGMTISGQNIIVVGNAYSTDGDISGNHGLSDVFIARISFFGAVENIVLLGGTSSETAYAVANSNDQGFIIAGISNSSDGDVPTNLGQQDIWVIKTDYTGALEWSKVFGGSAMDRPRGIIPTNDGEYLLLAESSSADGDLTSNSGFYDCWVAKLSQLGIVEWQQCFGGISFDGSFSGIQLSDGSYITANEIYAPESPGELTPHGGTDMVLKAFSADGTPTWESWYGGSGLERPYCLRKMSDSSWVMVGETNSIDGDVTGNHGDDDFWVVKFGDESLPLGFKNNSSTHMKIYPQPASELITIEMDTELTDAHYTLFDVLGNKIQTGIVNLNATFSLSVNSLPSGIYFLQIDTNTDQYSRTIQVTHSF